jgi:hypothetical protein
VNTPVHVAGMEHDVNVLMSMKENKPDEWLLQEIEEEEKAGKTTSVNGDNDPHIKL